MKCYALNLLLPQSGSLPMYCLIIMLMEYKHNHLWWSQFPFLLVRVWFIIVHWNLNSLIFHCNQSSKTLKAVTWNCNNHAIWSWLNLSTSFFLGWWLKHHVYSCYDTKVWEDCWEGCTVVFDGKASNLLPQHVVNTWNVWCRIWLLPEYRLEYTLKGIL